MRILLISVLAAAPVAAFGQQAIYSIYSEKAYQDLRELIGNTALNDMDLDFFERVYRFDHAPDLVKKVVTDPELKSQDPELDAKSERLAELRLYNELSTLAEYARQKYVTIEINNQGKSTGARSDLDNTGNILEVDLTKGAWRIKPGMPDLIAFQKREYAKQGLTPKGADVTLFDGDTFMPDVRDVRLGFTEYTNSLFRNTAKLKGSEGAYYAPGANQEQTHDRALAQGRTMRVGWDYVAGKPSINGRPIDFDPHTGKVVWLEYDKTKGEYRVGQPIEGMVTREAAVRYEGLETLPPGERWRRALGNVVQNMHEFNQPHDNDPVARNKYFIERVIDQGVGRFTELDPQAYALAEDPDTTPTYVQIQDSPKLPEADKNAWKQAYIQQGFGLPEGDPRIEQVRKVLDRSAEIQLDKLHNRGYQERARHAAGASYYYRDEWGQAVANTAQAALDLEQKAAAEGQPSPREAMSKLQEIEAERLFVEKQRLLISEAGSR